MEKCATWHTSQEQKLPSSDGSWQLTKPPSVDCWVARAASVTQRSITLYLGSVVGAHITSPALYAEWQNYNAEWPLRER